MQIHFESRALEIFKLQASMNKVYSTYLTLLKKDIQSVKTISQIPFLPIQFFKTHRVITGNENYEIVFTSSSTTGTGESKHYVKDVLHYYNNAKNIFEAQYGSLNEYSLVALLPSYLERQGSSLIAMVAHFMKCSPNHTHGFFLNDFEALQQKLLANEQQGIKTILWGVTYALLDFAAFINMPLPNTIIMETGGMKGRRQEKTKAEVHQILKKAFAVPYIHSEYGMTELLSQAYAIGNGLFAPNNTFKPLVRNIYNPFEVAEVGKGVLNVIDLANNDSCSFIATDDLVEIHPNGSFEILGRLDAAAIRGCNLLVDN